MRTNLVELLLALEWSPMAVLVLIAVRLLLEIVAATGASRYAQERLRFGSCRWRRLRPQMRRPRELSDGEWPYGTFLQRLAPPVRMTLLGLGVRRQVPAGQIVIHEGIRESHLVLLEEGLTKVTASLPDGRSALLSLRVGGDLVGEMSALNNAPAPRPSRPAGPQDTA